MEGQDKGKEKEETKSGTQLIALVVDDDKLAPSVHQGLLNRAGVKSHAMKNGQEAIDIHVSGQDFDLILMDKNMPKMNGIEATKKLRSLGIDRSMIVGATTCSTDDEIAEFMEAGLDDYKTKPLTTDTISEILDEVKIQKLWKYRVR